jgi:hypothetical protein
MPTSMKPKIYIETTIPSYLTAWPRQEPIRAAHQLLTRQWWDTKRSDFDLHTSQLVLQEAGSGDPIAAERLEVLRGITILGTDPTAERLAADLSREIPLPPKAAVDALHIAIAVVDRIDFLLTWNCTHIANAALWVAIDSICRSNGYQPTIISTPLELLGGSIHE